MAMLIWEAMGCIPRYMASMGIVCVCAPSILFHWQYDDQPVESCPFLDKLTFQVHSTMDSTIKDPAVFLWFKKVLLELIEALGLSLKLLII